VNIKGDDYDILPGVSGDKFLLVRTRVLCDSLAARCFHSFALSSQRSFSLHSKNTAREPVHLVEGVRH
jgi:hypothetical protein